MSDRNLTFAEQQSLIQQDYISGLPHRLYEVDQAWNALSTTKEWAAPLKQLHFHIHRIAGSAGTFGYPLLSEQARGIEKLIRPWMQEGCEPTEQERMELGDRITALRENLKNTTPVKIAAEQNIERTELDSDIPVVYILEDDLSFAEELALQLSHYGYSVLSFDNAKSIRQAIERQQPDLFIVDLVINGEDFAGTDFIKKIRQSVSSDIPSVVYSARGDFEARLNAVRAGADAYLVKPVEADLLVSKLDDLLGRKPTKPYQILLIDDDVTLANHYAWVLSRVGMQVRVLSQPERILDLLDELCPDLILMDVYMPNYSGVELANLIRQQDRFDNVPVIFLSTESDADKQMLAMRMGGDEFLTKPIMDKHLLVAVSIRAARARLLTNLVMQDSLTGLINHGRMKEQLKVEVARADRAKSTFVFVMFDIDHFKKVNDNYGHINGDRVIKGLAQLLQKRLRKNDIIARFGGEEFAVILEDCTPQAAYDLIDAIREDFSQITFYHDNQTFRVTFSAGIAVYPGNAPDDEKLAQVADEALYQAKMKGRNEVVVATDKQ